MSSLASEPMRYAGDPLQDQYPETSEAPDSAVSWPAIAAGAFVSAALALILLALGAGAGLSSLSPWANSGLSPSAVGVGALVWLAVIEIVSAGLGGYLAGRLRTKWVGVHSHEVYFRDTAHGLLAWAVATVVAAAFLTSAATIMVGGEIRNASASRSDDVPADAGRYFVDRLFRSAQPPSVNDAAIRAEASVILARAVRDRSLGADDQNYLTDLVASRTGVSRADASRRVTTTIEQDQQAVDTARKAAAHLLYWLFVALLLGAFSASWAATIGGKQRDHVHV